MSDKKYVLQFNAKGGSKVHVKFDNLERRESLLLLLNRAEINVSISLFEEDKK